MLICWDVSHPNLWQMYANRIDLMVISSFPVEVGHGIFDLPGGDHFSLEELGPRFTANANTVLLTFGDMLNQQSAWLGVPTVHSTACGHIRTPIPMGWRGLLGLATAAPWLLKYFSEANGLQLSCDLVQECKILDGNGQVLTRLSEEDEESSTLVEVHKPPVKQAPRGAQPLSMILRTSFFLADTFLPAVYQPVYRKGQRLLRNS